MSMTTTPSTYSLRREGHLFDTGVFGLFCLAAVTVHLALFQGGVIGPQGLGVGLSYGAFGLLSAGLAQWKRRRAFEAVLFSALGLFGFSLFALIVLPGCGYGSAPEASSLAAYLGLWSIFCALLATGAESHDRAIRVVLGLLTLFLLLMTIAVATMSPAFSAVAALLGLICTATAVAAGFLRRYKAGKDCRN